MLRTTERVGGASGAPRRTHWGLAVLAVLALVAAACGSSSSAKTTSTTAGPSSGTSGPSGSSDTGPNSYTLYYITDVSGNGGADEPTDAEFAGAVKAANARGGIDGHQINVVTCDAQSSNNAAAACGQQAVSAHAFAIIDYAAEPTFLPYAEKADIPVLNEGSSVQTWTSPVSFIINNGDLDASAGYIAVLHQEGCQSADMIITTDSAGAATVAALSGAMGSEATRLGMDYKGAISAPLTAPDMSPYATEAVDKNVQCIIPLAFGAQAVTLLQDLVPLAQAGKFQKVGICTCLVTPSVAVAEGPPIQQLGSHAILILAIESTLDTSNPAVKQWVTDEDTYGPKPPYLEYEGGTEWAELQLAIKAAEAVSPHINGPNVLDYLNHLTDYWPGISPAVDFTKPVPNPYGPRNFGAWVTPTSWDGGTVWPRTQPFISVLNGATNNNTGP